MHLRSALAVRRTPRTCARYWPRIETWACHLCTRRVQPGRCLPSSPPFNAITLVTAAVVCAAARGRACPVAQLLDRPLPFRFSLLDDAVVILVFVLKARLAGELEVGPPCHDFTRQRPEARPCRRSRPCCVAPTSPLDTSTRLCKLGLVWRPMELVEGRTTHLLAQNGPKIEEGSQIIFEKTIKQTSKNEDPL